MSFRSTLVPAIAIRAPSGDQAATGLVVWSVRLIGDRPTGVPSTSTTQTARPHVYRICSPSGDHATVWIQAKVGSGSPYCGCQYVPGMIVTRWASEPSAAIV